MTKTQKIVTATVLVALLALGAVLFIFQSSGSNLPLDNLNTPISLEQVSALYAKAANENQTLQAIGLRLADENPFVVLGVVPDGDDARMRVFRFIASDSQFFDAWSTGSVTSFSEMMEEEELNAYIADSASSYLDPISEEELAIVPDFPGRAILDSGDVIIQINLVVDSTGETIVAYAIVSPTGQLKYEFNIINFAPEIVFASWGYVPQ